MSNLTFKNLDALARYFRERQEIEELRASAIPGDGTMRTRANAVLRSRVWGTAAIIVSRTTISEGMVPCGYIDNRGKHFVTNFIGTGLCETAHEEFIRHCDHMGYTVLYKKAK